MCLVLHRELQLLLVCCLCYAYLRLYLDADIRRRLERLEAIEKVRKFAIFIYVYILF
jgi:hypothetical protein